MKRYRKARRQASPLTAPVERGPVELTLRDLILSHLSEWIPQLVDGEIEEFLGRKRYEQHGEQDTGNYRNGHHKARSLTCGMGTFPVRLARTCGVWVDAGHEAPRCSRHPGAGGAARPGLT